MWVNRLPMSWTDDQVRNHRRFRDTAGKGEAMVEARRVMGVFTNAQRDGYVGNLLPAPGTRYDPEYVDRALGRVDQQYSTEIRGRGRGRSHPGFNTMADAQRLAMLQLLRVALGRGE